MEETQQFFSYGAAITILSCMLLLSFITTVQSAPQDAVITQLPGFNGAFPSKHYSGYISIGNDNVGKPPKNLFYYFVTSETHPSRDPVVLWLNGGPGCSSFDGFIYEHGPFNFKAGKNSDSMPTLHLNPYSWSKVSNIIYLDSPAGVGLSYIDDETSYQNGDLQTAADTHSFLLQWFKQYPEFIQNPFYIAGESYAGIYVPTLAAQVVQGLKANVHPTINLKGYMIGNGAIADSSYDRDSLVEFAHGMALIPNELYKNVTSACGVNYFDSTDVECQVYADKLSKNLDGLNIYDILEPCYHHSSDNNKLNDTRLPGGSFGQLGKATDKLMPVRKRIYGRAWPYGMAIKDGLVPSWPQLNAAAERGVTVPCTNDGVGKAWLNNDSVRKAIHAQLVKDIGPWSLCMDINFYHDSGSMIDYHRNLTSQGFRALIYSGDHDMCVPYTGTEAWTMSLGYNIIDEWRPWMVNDQVAGFQRGFDHNLVFLTIKGAGHTVPEYKPQEALAFYSRWLQGKAI